MLLFVQNEKRVGNVIYTPGMHDVDDVNAQTLLNSGSAIKAGSKSEAEDLPTVNTAGENTTAEKTAKTKAAGNVQTTAELEKDTTKEVVDPNVNAEGKEPTEAEKAAEEEKNKQPGKKLSKRAKAVLEKLNLSHEEVKELSKEELMEFDGVSEAIATELLEG